jgi:hypothetical protein
MPLIEEGCDSCGSKKDKCPECGSDFVTPRDNPGQRSPNHHVDYGGEGIFTYKHICWDCGWSEEVTVEITREDKNE